LVPKTDENVPHHSSRKLFLECLYFVNEKKRKKEKRFCSNLSEKKKKKKKKKSKKLKNFLKPYKFFPIKNFKY